MVPALTYSPGPAFAGQVLPSAQTSLTSKPAPSIIFMKYKVPASTYSPGAYAQVPSAQAGLTSEFGMGSGVALPQGIPRLYIPFF